MTLMSCHGISLNLSLIVEATESDKFLVYSSKPLLSNFSKKGKMTVDQSRTQYKIFAPPIPLQHPLIQIRYRERHTINFPVCRLYIHVLFFPDVMLYSKTFESDLF